jgi:hypothetical protein
MVKLKLSTPTKEPHRFDKFLSFISAMQPPK